MDAVERIASKAAASLTKVGRSEQISDQNMLKLYRTIVLPVMEYGSTVWQIGYCEQLDINAGKMSSFMPRNSCKIRYRSQISSV